MNLELRKAMRTVMIPIVLAAHCALGQGVTPHLVLLAPEGTRIARFVPSLIGVAPPFEDCVIVGLHNVSAIRFNDYDTSFYVVCAGDSGTGAHAGIYRFPASAVLQQTITPSDSLPILGGASPADILFPAPGRALLSIFGANQLAAIRLTVPLRDFTADTVLAMPARPSGLLQLTRSRSYVICAGAPGSDTSWVVLLDTDADTIVARRALPATAQWGVRDRNLHLEVLSRRSATESVVTVLDSNLVVDTTFRFVGDYGQISITASVDTGYERGLLSNGAADTGVAQYNPLTREVFGSAFLHARLAIGYGGEIVSFTSGKVNIYLVDRGGAVVPSASVLIQPFATCPAFLDVEPIYLSGVAEHLPVESQVFTLSCAPVPCSVATEVTIANAHNPLVRLTDVLGREVMPATRAIASHLHIDTSRLPAGMYYCTVRDGLRAAATRILVAK